MTDASSLVTTLARLPAGPPVVSLYLDARWRDQHQRERVRLFVHDTLRSLPRDAAPSEQLEETLAAVAAHVDALVNQDLLPDVRGLALFASAARGLFEQLAVDATFEPLLVVDERPVIAPLVEAVGLDRPALVACVESPAVTVLELSAGRVVDAQTIVREIPRRHSAGGWQQRHLQRSLRAYIRQVWQEGARLMERLAAEDATRAVVLLGQPPATRGFERELSAGLRARVVGRALLPHDRADAVARALELLALERTDRESALVRRVAEAGLSERGGAVGLQPTLLAANGGRIRLLALSSRFNATGYRCDRCEALSETAPGGSCAFCGAAARAVALREPLVRRVAGQGGAVVLAREVGPLDAWRGIGCLLRRRASAPRQPEALMMVPSVPPEFVRSVVR